MTSTCDFLELSPARGADWTAPQRGWQPEAAVCDSASRSLESVVAEAIRKLDPEDPLVKRAFCWHPESRPRVLLRVLVQAYAAEIYESEQIAEVCELGTMFRRSCGDWAPNPTDLTRFRRDNRELLRGILARVLLAVKQGEDRLGFGYDLEQETRMLARAGTRLDIARQLDTDAE